MTSWRRDEQVWVLYTDLTRVGGHQISVLLLLRNFPILTSPKLSNSHPCIFLYNIHTNFIFNRYQSSCNVATPAKYIVDSKMLRYDFKNFYFDLTEKLTNGILVNPPQHSKYYRSTVCRSLNHPSYSFQQSWPDMWCHLALVNHSESNIVSTLGYFPGEFLFRFIYSLRPVDTHIYMCVVRSFVPSCACVWLGKVIIFPDNDLALNKLPIILTLTLQGHQGNDISPVTQSWACWRLFLGLPNEELFKKPYVHVSYSYQVSLFLLGNISVYIQFLY